MNKPIMKARPKESSVHSPKDFDIIIGIDPGVNTGISIWDNRNKKLLSVESMTHHEAAEKVKYVKGFLSSHVLVRYEDAGLRKWVTGGREKLQGVGSVKRDCNLWKEFCTLNDIAFQAIAPKNNKTKLKAEMFEKYTGWKGTTNEHGRDSGMLVFGI